MISFVNYTPRHTRFRSMKVKIHFKIQFTLKRHLNLVDCSLEKPWTYPWLPLTITSGLVELLSMIALAPHLLKYNSEQNF